MPNLRQLVIAAEDPERLAKFYQEVFDLEKIDDNQGALFLSDGTFNLGLLPEAGRGEMRLSSSWLRYRACRVDPHKARPCGTWRRARLAR